MFKCEICGQECKGYLGLGPHVSRIHKISTQEYYDMYIRIDVNEDICDREGCSNKVTFKNMRCGYHKCCSKTCIRYNKESRKKLKQTMKERYGVEYYTIAGDFQEKYKKTCLEKYGVEHATQSEEVKSNQKNTMLERYGVVSNLQLESTKYKIKQTNIERYGVENPMQSEEIKERMKQNNIEKYGVEYTLQLKEVKEKGKQTCLERYGIEHPIQLIQNPSKPQVELFDLVNSIYLDAKINYPCLTYSIDIAIPSYKIAIEYDGSYWHKGREEQDKIRQEKIENEGWKFIRYVDRIPNKIDLLEDIKRFIN